MKSYAEVTIQGWDDSGELDKYPRKSIIYQQTINLENLELFKIIKAVNKEV